MVKLSYAVTNKAHIVSCVWPHVGWYCVFTSLKCISLFVFFSGSEHTLLLTNNLFSQCTIVQQKHRGKFTFLLLMCMIK